MDPNGQYGFNFSGQNANSQEQQQWQRQAMAQGFGMNGYVPSYDSRMVMAQRPQSPIGPVNMSAPNSQQINSQFVGKFIGAPEEILLSDIPMDGRPAIFPARDCSSIIVKLWKQDGQLLTIRYIVDPNQFQEQDNQRAEMEDIRTRLQTIEQSLKASKPPRTTKKEDTPNG